MTNQTPETPSAFQALLNSIPWINNRGLITGPMVFGAFAVVGVSAAFLAGDNVYTGTNTFNGAVALNGPVTFATPPSGGGSGASLTGNNIFSGSNTFNGPVTMATPLPPAAGGTGFSSLGQLSAALGITLPNYELNFAANSAPFGCASIAACLTVTNSGGYAQWLDGHWSGFAANTARITDQGLLREPASTNNVLFSRDMTQSAWVKSGATAALTATGLDLGANAASTLTATAANGTVCQSMTVAAGTYGEQTFSVFLKRVSGTGEVDLSLETAPGHTSPVYNPITLAGQVPALSASWQRFNLTFDGMSNPTVCVRIVASGDVVAADFAQEEAQVWATSPIYTTSAVQTRGADVASLSGVIAAQLNSGTATLIASETGINAGNFRHQIAAPILGGASADLYSWQYAANAIFDNPNGGTPAGATPFAICGATNVIDADQSLALPVVYGMAWSPTSFIMDCDGAGAFVGPGSAPGSQTWYLGSATSAPTSYLSDLRVFNSAFTISALQAATAKSNRVQITDPDPYLQEWNDYTAANGNISVGGTNPPGGGTGQQSWLIESGLGTSGVTAPLQAGPVGNYLRFNLFANNCWVSDFCQIGSYGGSQRSELDGSGFAFNNGTEVWVSYSDCIEPGPDLTTNWFITGQFLPAIANAAGGGPAFDISGKIGNLRHIDYTTNGGVSQITGYEWPLVRGKWENMVLDVIMDPTGATGKINVWKNGVQVVNYAGPTGTTPPSGTQSYRFKFGIYSSQAPEYQAARYANVTYSATASLASKVTSPDPIATGYGTTCQ